MCLFVCLFVCLFLVLPISLLMNCISNAGSGYFVNYLPLPSAKTEYVASGIHLFHTGMYRFR